MYLFRYAFKDGKAKEGSHFIESKLKGIDMKSNDGFLERRGFTNGLWQDEYTNLMWVEFSSMESLSKYGTATTKLARTVQNGALQGSEGLEIGTEQRLTVVNGRRKQHPFPVPCTLFLFRALPVQVRVRGRCFRGCPEGGQGKVFLQIRHVHHGSKRWFPGWTILPRYMS